MDNAQFANPEIACLCKCNGVESGLPLCSQALFLRHILDIKNLELVEFPRLLVFEIKPKASAFFHEIITN